MTRQGKVGWLLAVVVGFSLQARAEATVLYFSLSIDNIIDGVEYDKDDIVKYDTTSGDSSLFFDGDSVFKSDREDIDAFYIFPNGDLLLSTTRGADIGALSFKDEDLVRVNPLTKTASLFFDGSAVFDKNEDLHAVDLLPDGKIVFGSTSGAIDGLEFNQKDLVLYDPSTGDASIYFEGEDHFGGKKGAIKGLDILPDGRLVMIVWGDSGRQAKLGGAEIGRRDIVLYNPFTKVLDTVLVNGDDIFERSSHQHDQGFDAVYVPDPENPVIPEPVSFSLFGLGALGLGFISRKRQSLG